MIQVRRTAPSIMGSSRFICQVYDKNKRDFAAFPLRSQNNMNFQYRGAQAQSS